MTTAWGQVLPEEQSRVRRDTGFYVFAAGAGMFAGWVDIKAGDLLLTALLVLAPCMLTQKPYRAQIYESFLAFLPGIAGAYGGSLLRLAFTNISGNK
jgi:hypothetical protein